MTRKEIIRDFNKSTRRSSFVRESIEPETTKQSITRIDRYNLRSKAPQAVSGERHILFKGVHLV